MQTALSHEIGRTLPIAVASPLVGRDHDIQTVLDLLTQGAPQVVTLTGPGGVGKTSFALEVAHRAKAHFGNRIHVVMLAAMSEPERLLSEIAHQLGLIEAPGMNRFDLIVGGFSAGPSLLVLDNFEQLIDASVEISRLASAAPTLRILISSRETLGIRQELNYPVRPLPVDAPDDGSTAPAVQLFLSCAFRAGANIGKSTGELDSVRAICAKLDGLPLAIELASSWTPSMTPAAITSLLARQPGSLRTSRRDAPDRHRSLRSAMAWSYNLLSPEEQRFFRALSTFNGSFDIGAAAYLTSDGSAPNEVLALHQMASLISKNLAKPAPNAGAIEDRYELLETIRAFGRELAVQAGEDRALRDLHTQYYLTFVEEFAPRLVSPERVPTLERFDREYPNIRTAISWMIESGSIDAAHRILARIWRYWEPRGFLTEGQSWADAILAMPGELDTETRAWALYAAAVMPMRQGNFDRSRALAEACMEQFQSIEHVEGTAFALNMLGILAYELGAFDEAIAMHRRALDIRKAQGNPDLIETSLVNLAIALFLNGELEESKELYQQAYEMETARGHSHGVAFTLNGLGLVAERQGDLATAREYHERAIAIRRGEDTGSLAASLVNLGSVLRSQGERASALLAYQEAIQLRRDRGEIPGLLEAIEGLAYLAADAGELDTAAMMLATVVERRKALGTRKIDPWGYRRMELPISIEDAPVCTLTEIVDIALGLQGEAFDDAGEAPAADRPNLTRREREVLALLAAGKSDQEIADELFIARATASRHVANLFAKLGISSRAAAAAWYARLELDDSN